jgi:hypothetical protein
MPQQVNKYTNKIKDIFKLLQKEVNIRNGLIKNRGRWVSEAVDQFMEYQTEYDIDEYLRQYGYSKAEDLFIQNFNSEELLEFDDRKERNYWLLYTILHCHIP